MRFKAGKLAGQLTFLILCFLIISTYILANFVYAVASSPINSLFRLDFLFAFFYENNTKNPLTIYLNK